MKIILDLQPLQSVSKTRGIGRYTLSFTKAILEYADQHDFYAVFSHLLSDDLEQDMAEVCNFLNPQKILTWRTPVPVSEIDPANINRTRAAELIREHFLKSQNPDVVHLCSLFEGWNDNSVTSVESPDSNISTTVTLHDLIPLCYQQRYLKNSIVKQWYARKLYHLKQSNLLFAISESAKREAIELLEFPAESVINSSSDADPLFRPVRLPPWEADNLKIKSGITRPFIMYTGGDDPRKNVEKLVLAYASLPEKQQSAYQLIIIYQQSPDEKKHYTRLCKKLGLKPDAVIFPGYVTDDELNKLYNLCWLFVFPSEHEGFGLPILEAMRCGAPVIGSDRSSIPEVIGRKDALFEPDVSGIADKIQQVLLNENFRQELIEHSKIQQKQFSWKNTAAMHIEAFESLYEKKQSARKTQITNPLNRPRLAYVSPLPPENSGIADYSAELLPELARYYHIDLITTADPPDDDYLLANFKIISVEQFKQTAHQYQRILYHFGNSSFHLHMFHLLEEYPGTVILHDFYLGDAVLSIDSLDRSQHYFKQQLYQSHGYSALNYLQEEGLKQAILRYPCNLNVIDSAVGVIVHSNHSLSLAEKVYGYSQPGRWSVQKLARKLPFFPDRKQARNDARTSLSITEDMFLVCSFGDIVESKQSVSIVEAWINSKLSQNSLCELTFVGTPKDPQYEQTLKNIIKQSGFVSRITITGYVKSEIYQNYLAAADMAIQLRSHSRGETSISILDTLSYGLPTIVNVHGAFAEIPDETVYKLEDTFVPEQLIDAMEKLFADENYRNHLTSAGIKYVKQFHSPAKVAQEYAHAIECFAESHPLMERQKLFSRLATIEELEESDLIQAAISVNENEVIYCPQLLIDISVLVNIDAKTGIQRVVKNILINLLRNPPAGVKIEPVYRQDGRYRYARQYILTLLNVQPDVLDESLVDIQKDDIFLGLDLDIGLAADTKAIEYLSYQKQRGLQCHFLVYDLLPVVSSEWFPDEINQNYTQWLEIIVKLGNGFSCISDSVARSMKNWMESNQHHPEKVADIGFFHLGADIPIDISTSESVKILDEIFSHRERQLSFLVVGTIEPRKGHRQTLSAMELLWQQGIECNLIIVGKQGWKMDDFIDVLDQHPQKNKHLFWLDSVSDEELMSLYSNCSALLNPSAGEGFGLPLIEAAQAGLPIIARDLPVFEEVAGEHAFYFSGYDASSLMQAILAWIELYQNEKHPQSQDLPWLTWEQSAFQLLQCLHLS